MREAQHAEADDLFCETLDGLGYSVDVFREMEKWYA